MYWFKIHCSIQLVHLVVFWTVQIVLLSVAVRLNVLDGGKYSFCNYEVPSKY